ncbi:MAG: NUDIX domain-containing protein, partial [Gemmatimonadaceae bacterium]
VTTVARVVEPPEFRRAVALRVAHRNQPLAVMATINVGTVDVILISPRTDGWRILTLQRAKDTRCPMAWETVHGRIEPGEQPEHAAVREVREETGLDIARLYNVCVQPFYLHHTHTVELAVTFAAFVDPAAELTLGAEHARSEWLEPERALKRFVWPRERAALRDVLLLLQRGDAGPVEDVLRVF